MNNRVTNCMWLAGVIMAFVLGILIGISTTRINEMTVADTLFNIQEDYAQARELMEYGYAHSNEIALEDGNYYFMRAEGHLFDAIYLLGTGEER